MTRYGLLRSKKKRLVSRRRWGRLLKALSITGRLLCVGFALSRSWTSWWESRRSRNGNGCKPALEGLGYDYAEGAGVPGHYIFGRGRDRTERTHLVHVVEFAGESWRGELARFATRYGGMRGLRESYAREKERAAAVAPGNRAAYNAQKGPFIAESMKRLLEHPL